MSIVAEEVCTPLNQVLANELSQQVDAALASLKPKQRDAVELMFGIHCEGPHTPKEIAEIMRETPGAVNYFLDRALIKLKRGYVTNVILKDYNPKSGLYR